MHRFPLVLVLSLLSSGCAQASLGLGLAFVGLWLCNFTDKKGLTPDIPRFQFPWDYNIIQRQTLLSITVFNFKFMSNKGSIFSHGVPSLSQWVPNMFHEDPHMSHEVPNLSHEVSNLFHKVGKV